MDIARRKLMLVNGYWDLKCYRYKLQATQGQTRGITRVFPKHSFPITWKPKPLLQLKCFFNTLYYQQLSYVMYLPYHFIGRRSSD